ncbi:hypothetical protein ACF0H5_018445 [Mactra antiquata]
MFIKSVVGLLFVTICVLQFTDGQVPIGTCRKINSCSCYYDDGTIVNLEPLDRKDGKPNFNNVTDSTHDLYSWNPCTPFSYPSNDSHCQNVSICMIRKNIPQELLYDLGNQDSAKFSVNTNGSLILTYTADNGDYKRVSEITLQCMETSKFNFFVAEGEQETHNDTVTYKFTLASAVACPRGPNINPSENVSPLSGVEIFFIVLGSLIGSYIVLGVMFQAFVKKESGKRLCPNHEFWFNIPGCIKGGCKTGGSASAATKYDSI